MSHMEMIFIDSNRQARKTGVGAAFDTNSSTWEAFREARTLGVPIEQAQFLLDYYNRKGDLAGTIPLTAEGFTKLSGEPVLPEADYLRIDREFWADFKKGFAP